MGRRLFFALLMAVLTLGGPAYAYRPPAKGEPFATLVLVKNYKDHLFQSTSQTISTPDDTFCSAKRIAWVIWATGKESSARVAAGADIMLAVSSSRLRAVNMRTDESLDCTNHLTLKTEAGHRYEVRHTLTETECFTEILDVTTGQPAQVTPLTGEQFCRAGGPGKKAKLARHKPL